ncbi:tetratricopeptide repeat protein [Microbulbifer spongiae]|uniref:Tetratricopeptide repeat protein n=1 Tax=Microbulbifer spongiae TaxID=2944933 RepID=A0ABY9EAQ8_9GAMM|nr:tetratricopeptide repeat protein [Microbulbifer sp. MI-G]WKD48529.1 tetratricopeptide repeat protein [Microbulbifer sp. MI-G]
MKRFVLFLALLLCLPAQAAEQNYHARIKAIERIRLHARSAGQLLALGDHYYRLGKLERAYQQLDLLLQHDRKNIEGWLLMGSLWRAWGQWAEALEAYDLALALAPQRADIHLRRGQAFEQLGRQDEADQAYARYRALDKN